ncbi:hypothetical protein F4680DRAFT_418265 [Xylaria scruposa]|nr:hypothetical protein F4680DRAFT_418265 [Xylaria scruposa]
MSVGLRQRFCCQYTIPSSPCNSARYLCWETISERTLGERSKKSRENLGNMTYQRHNILNHSFAQSLIVFASSLFGILPSSSRYFVLLATTFVRASSSLSSSRSASFNSLLSAFTTLIISSPIFSLWPAASTIWVFSRSATLDVRPIIAILRWVYQPTNQRA